MKDLEINTDWLDNLDWAIHYKEYLSLQKQGLRKFAFKSLEKFILDFKRQDKQIKWKFIDFANKLSKEKNDYSLYMPLNLYNEVFKTELNDWIRCEPNNPLPYKWSSDLSLVMRAIQLDPFDQESLDIFFTRLVNMISLNQHEIESGFGYSGNPQKDVDLINDSLQYLENMEDINKKKIFHQSLEELKQAALKIINENHI